MHIRKISNKISNSNTKEQNVHLQWNQFETSIQLKILIKHI